LAIRKRTIWIADVREGFAIVSVQAMRGAQPIYPGSILQNTVYTILDWVRRPIGVSISFAVSGAILDFSDGDTAESFAVVASHPINGAEPDHAFVVLKNSVDIIVAQAVFFGVFGKIFTVIAVNAAVFGTVPKVASAVLQHRAAGAGAGFCDELGDGFGVFWGRMLLILGLAGSKKQDEKCKKCDARHGEKLKVEYFLKTSEKSDLDNQARFLSKPNFCLNQNFQNFRIVEL
jgi:hypothetical protein